MDGDISAIDLSSVAFEKSLIIKRMQNGAEDRGARKPSRCPESVRHPCPRPYLHIFLSTSELLLCGTG